MDFSNLNIKKLYIKWDEKLVITADNIEVTTNNKPDETLNYKKRFKSLIYILKNSNEFSDLVQRVDIKNISVNDLSATFKYKIGEKSYLTIKSDKIKFNCNIDADNKHTVIDIEEFENSSKSVMLVGKVILDNINETLSGKIDADIYDDAKLHLYVYSNKDDIFYALYSDNKIQNLQKILKLLPIPEYVNPWIYDAIQMSDADVKKLYGYIEFSNPRSIIKNIYADVDLYDVNYTFDKRLAPIITSSTNVVFQNGILDIYPKNGTFYKHELKSSYLDIDLNRNRNILTVYLRDMLVLDDDLLYLLKTYNIDIPFVQTASKTDTNLDIAVKLATFNVDVNGTFKVEDGDFLYNGLNLHAKDGLLTLNGAYVDIKKLKLSYQDKIESDVVGYLNPVKHLGNLHIDINKAAFASNRLSLANEQDKLSLIYKAAPSGDTIAVSPSTWQYEKDKIKVDNFDMRFDFKALYANIFATQISIQDKVYAYLSGDIDLKNIIANLKLDILKLEYKNFKLDQTMLPISIKYDKGLTADLLTQSIWKLKKTSLTLSPSRIILDDDYLKFIDSSVAVENMFNSNFYMAYDINKSIGYLSLSKPDVKNKYLKYFFNKNGTYNLKIDKNSRDTKIFMDKYSLEFDLGEDDRWALKCDDIGKIYKKMPYFTDYNITQGNMNIFSGDTSDDFSFNGKIKYPYKLLVKDNIPVEDYYFNGKYKPDVIDINVNNNLNLKINKDVEIKSTELGFNVPEIIRFNNDHTMKKQNQDTMPITLAADNSYLYFQEKRKILADTLKVQYLNSETTAQLKFKDGNAGFNLNKYGIFYLHGLNFDDEFMDALFTTSKFKNGELSFTLNGALDNFAGIIEIKKTVLIDYKVLNNVFAFINTVPSLITFSLPDYSKDGLKVESMYAGFTAKNALFDFTDISLNSKEIKIYGKGTLDFRSEDINLDLNLKTDLASKVSKIPIVGYILFDKDSISTSLKVTGNIYDPKVTTSIAKDIVIAPLNIIKRTLLLPIELLSPGSI
ncbi:AsmA-like C-terminal domain-containing protein [bacterium]|nr:AsmA-like C-terminal domain-containing protein [bacterium]MBU1884366.1 AsmA-like C-terminal domain-containing protein [bacterium]